MALEINKKTVILSLILVVIALVSLFLISGIASSEDSFQGTCSSLEEKRTNVTELMGVTAASSTAFFNKALNPLPLKILSPSTKQAESLPINFSPMIKAWANPSGDGCSAYSNLQP